MIRGLIRVFVILIIVLGGAFACTYEAFRSTCTQIWLTEVKSPDGAWKAVEYGTLYEGPFLTYIDAEVRLISIRDPARSAVIFEVPANAVVQRPGIVWTGPQILRATVHSSVTVNAMMCEFEGVRIEIRFPPDEAARRAAWHHQQGEPDPGADVASTSPCP